MNAISEMEIVPIISYLYLLSAIQVEHTHQKNEKQNQNYLENCMKNVCASVHVSCNVNLLHMRCKIFKHVKTDCEPNRMIRHVYMRSKSEFSKKRTAKGRGKPKWLRMADT